jgi:hypothetical protein
VRRPQTVPSAELADWPNLLCDAPGCGRLADGLLDGRPLCCDDADLIIERAEAVHLAPSLRSTLPPLFER